MYLKIGAFRAMGFYDISYNLSNDLIDNQFSSNYDERMKEMASQVAIETITGEGVKIDIENMTIQEAKDRCRENFDGTCMQDLMPCDLSVSGSCHRGSPCIIAQKLRG